MLRRWWNWIRRKGWTLVEVEATSVISMFPTRMSPYFWEVWENDETKEIKIVAKT
jgi:hypothetical protein